MNNDSLAERAKKLLKSAVTTISPKLTCRILFFLAFHRALDLDNPRTLDEKLCWLKVNYYGDQPLVQQCADKYRVREYVRDCGLGFLLNECYAAYDRVEDIPWDELPDSFVLKGNHGCAYNILCPDKSELDIPEAKKLLRRWMREDYWKLNAELNYKNIPKKIVCEAFLRTEDGGPIADYKLYCFNGEPYSIMVCTDRGIGDTKFYFFDRDWNLLRINPDSKAAPEGFTLPKPETVDDMFRYAKILAEPFPFVRVDFYAIADRIIFGELTFTPASAMDVNRLPETDRMLGQMLRLPIEVQDE